MSRKSWNLEDGPTKITIVIDTLRRPRSETNGRFVPSGKAERLIGVIAKLVNETERGASGIS